jgi:hypothetical protein
LLYADGLWLFFDGSWGHNFFTCDLKIHLTIIRKLLFAVNNCKLLGLLCEKHK